MSADSSQIPYAAPVVESVMVSSARVADEIESAAWRELYAAAPAPIARALGIHTSIVADATVIVARALPMALFNRAFGLGDTADVAESDLDAVLRTFEEHGAASPWMQHGPASRARAMPQWLVSRGFRPVPRAWAMMMREREPAPVIETEFAIRAVELDQASRFAKALAIAHGMPPALAEWTSVLIGRPGWHGYAAWDGDTIAAGGMVFIHGDRAWVGLGGTLPAYRGRGAQGALLARRVDHVISAGCSVMGTETGEPVGGERSSSFDNMKRTGFHQVASRMNYER